MFCMGTEFCCLQISCPLLGFQDQFYMNEKLSNKGEKRMELDMKKIPTKKPMS